MKVFSVAAVAVFGVLCLSFVFGTNAQQRSRYLAFCDDGDGPISTWVSNRDEAYLAGREHERANRGHHWTVLTQEATGPRDSDSCAVTMPGRKEGVIRVINTCTECKIFKVSRRSEGEKAVVKEVTFKPNSSRYFRSMTGSVFQIDHEGSCPGN